MIKEYLDLVERQLPPKAIRHLIASRRVKRVDWSTIPPKVENWHVDTANGWTFSVLVNPHHGLLEVMAWPIGQDFDRDRTDWFVFSTGREEVTGLDEAGVIERLVEVCNAPPAKTRSGT